MWSVPYAFFFSQIHLFLKSLILPNPSLSLQSKSNRRSLLRRCRGHRARHHRRHSFLHPFVFGWWRTDAVSTPTPPTPTTAPSPASPSSVGFEETLRGVQLYQEKYKEKLEAKYGEDLSNAPPIDRSAWLEAIGGSKKGRENPAVNLLNQYIQLLL
ncbi:hypothetical protein Tsubulata_005738, partial [Turnera subulata]